MTEEEVWAARSDVFKVGYQEVLAALKHQDDKLNRVLTAIAFLTAAGASLYSNVGRNIRLTFDGRAAHVPTVLFVVFLVSVVFALGSALAAIGPSRTIPWRKGSGAPSSLLYYAAIGRDDLWDDELAKTSVALHEQLARNFHSEARSLANRVMYKVARAREAGAFVQAAIVSLSLLGIFSASDLGSTTRWWIAAAVMEAVLLLPLWELIPMRLFRFPEGKPYLTGYLLIGLIAGFGAILLFAAPAWGARWEALSYAGLAAVCARFALIKFEFTRILLPMAALAGFILILYCRLTAL